MADKPESGKNLLEDRLFKSAFILALSSAKSEVRAANDRKGLFYNPDWANKPLGCVIRKKSGNFEHSHPEPGVLRGLETKGLGFTGGYVSIKDATAIVIAMQPWATKQTILANSDTFMKLSKKVKAPVFVDETFDRQGSGIFLYEKGNEPLEIDLTSK